VSGELMDVVATIPSRPLGATAVDMDENLPEDETSREACEYIWL
jgi:hypothetical protein